MSLKKECVGRATKNSQGVYLDRAAALRAVKHDFGDFSLNYNIHSGEPSGIDKNLLHDLVNNNFHITNEEITDILYVDNLTVFRYLKQLRDFSRLDASGNF